MLAGYPRKGENMKEQKTREIKAIFTDTEQGTEIRIDAHMRWRDLLALADWCISMMDSFNDLSAACYDGKGGIR